MIRAPLLGLLAGLLLLAAAALAEPRAEAAPRAAALGPEMPLAEANGFVGKIAATPARGPVGTPVTVTGTGFTAGEELDLVWRTVIGGWRTGNGEYHGREFRPVGYRIARVTTDAEGGFSTGFVAPEDFGFEHDIVVQKGERLLTQTAFSIDMTMTLSPENGPAGTPISVEVTGIGWRELENSWTLVYDNGFTGWVSSVSTGGTARFTVPATGSPGTHVLRLVHGAFTFPYLNPEQNPVPDRPRPRAEFRLVEGEPVLPAPAEAQRQTAVWSLPPAGDLAVTPAFAGVGDPVTVEATDLRPGAAYKLSWGTVVGNRVVAMGWEERSAVIAEATADAEGRARFGFTVPVDLGGPHALKLEGEGAERKASFWLTPTALPLSVASGPAGTPITLHLKGVGWTETANIYTVVYDNAYLGYACGFNSQGDVTINLTASGAPGWHFIDVYPAIYKGKEKRPNNFLIPQLTYAEDHPGEDLPAFRYAFHVTAEGAAD